MYSIVDKLPRPRRIRSARRRQEKPFSGRRHTNEKITRILSLILVVCTLAGMLMLPAQAASTASWSSLGISASNTIKCYLKDAKNAPTYTSTTLKTKSGSVYTDDEITIRKIGQNSSGEWYAYINYPLTSTGGTKNAYVF